MGKLMEIAIGIKENNAEQVLKNTSSSEITRLLPIAIDYAKRQYGPVGIPRWEVVHALNNEFFQRLSVDELSENLATETLARRIR